MDDNAINETIVIDDDSGDEEDFGDFEFVDSHDSSQYSTDEEAAATARSQSRTSAKPTTGTKTAPVAPVTSPTAEPVKESTTSTTTADMKPEPMHVDEAPLPDIIGNDGYAEQMKTKGNDEYKAQNYAAALRYYSDAITLCPETASYYGNRSACQMMLGNHRAALQDCKTAVRLDDKFEKGYVRMAKCSIALGDLTGFEQAMKRLRELDPRANVQLKVELQQLAQLRDLEQKAMACYEKEDFRTTVFHMDSAVKVAPNCQRYKLLKAECLAQLGRVDDACDLAVSVMKVDSNSADAIYVRGLCLYYGDNLDKAVQHFERALQLDPDHGKAKQARQLARKWKELKERGNQLFNSGKYRDAMQCYTEVLQVDPRAQSLNSKVFYNRALVNSKLGNLMDAIGDCSAALAANQAYLKALLLRARCHNDLEMYEECVRDYEQAQTQQKTIEIRQLLNEAKVNLKRSKRKDYYKILGVGKQASTEEIKKAYRKRAMVHHPDRHSHSSDAEKKEQEKKFKEVGEAYAILSDAQKRMRYDSGKDMDDQFGGGGGCENMFDASQLFRHFNMEFPGGGGGGGGGCGRSGASFHFG